MTLLSAKGGFANSLKARKSVERAVARHCRLVRDYVDTGKFVQLAYQFRSLVCLSHARSQVEKWVFPSRVGLRPPGPLQRFRGLGLFSLAEKPLKLAGSL